MMKTLTLTLPDSIDLDKDEILMMIAVRLYERAVLSLGQAAELAGKSKRDFVESLGSYGVSIFNAPASEIAQDVKNANGLDRPANYSTRSERLEKLRISLVDTRLEPLSLEDFKAERRQIWKALID